MTISLAAKLSASIESKKSSPALKSQPSFPSAQEWKSKFQGSTAPATTKEYTGNQMLGIATMHKSNAVPVFSQESAKEIGKMK